MGEVIGWAWMAVLTLAGLALAIGRRTEHRKTPDWPHHPPPE